MDNYLKSCYYELWPQKVLFQKVPDGYPMNFDMYMSRALFTKLFWYLLNSSNPHLCQNKNRIKGYLKTAHYHGKQEDKCYIIM